MSDDKMVIVFRHALKSSWVKAAIVQLILNNPNVRIGLFSSTPKLMNAMLASIADLLCHKSLQRLFRDILRPPGKEHRDWEKYSVHDGELTVKRDPAFGYVPQEPQIMALSNLKKVTGLRVDYAFCDDIVDPDGVKSPRMMENIEDWWSYIQSCLSGGGYTTVTGTFYHYSDLYNKIIDEQQIPRKNIFIRPLFLNEKNQYPNHFTKKEIKRLKVRQRPYIFSCQYNLDPVPKGDEVFPPPHPTYENLPDDIYDYYIAVDPAPTTHDYSDKTGVVVAAVNKIGHVWVEEAEGLKKHGDEIANYLIRKTLQYKPKKIGIEFGIQVELERTIRTMVADYERKHRIRVPMNIEAIPLSSKISKLDRVDMSFGSYVRLRKIKIKETCVDLLRQMDFFTGRGGKEKDDLVDATAMIFAVADGLACNWARPMPNFVQMRKYKDLFHGRGKKGYAWGSEFAHYGAAAS